MSFNLGTLFRALEFGFFTMGGFFHHDPIEDFLREIFVIRGKVVVLPL